MPPFFDLVLSFAAGSTLSFLAAKLHQRKKLGGFEKIAQEIVHHAEKEAAGLLQSAELERKQRGLDLQKESEDFLRQERKKISQEEARLKEKEDRLDSRFTELEKKIAENEKLQTKQLQKRELLEKELEEVEKQQTKLRKTLESLSGITEEQAKEQLFCQLEQELAEERSLLILKRKKEAKESAEQEVSKILATCINRLAISAVSEGCVNTVPLPSEEYKGRIIGRDGRNIRALERITGVSCVIDDTPQAIVLSCCDPIRLAIAKKALSDLISDGRIHPTRIEETVESAKVSVAKKIIAYGEEAARKAGQAHLHPELIEMLGKLKFRYSFGQNVLEHSLEVSYLMGMIAAELKLDVSLAKRMGLLHDIGKAVSHEVKGSHALIGKEIALRCGEKAEVANGIGCHHNEIEPITTEAVFLGAADSISASRPGARAEAIEEYIKRVKKLEDLAYEFPGIEKAYALQAGKELLAVVLPDMIDDPGAVNLARDLSKKIEQELQYPGTIKVTVIREKRAIEYAR